MVATVGLSVYRHGLSALPLTERYVRWYERTRSSYPRWRASRQQSSRRGRASRLKGAAEAAPTQWTSAYGLGKTTGLRFPSVSTARTPKKKLSFDMFTTV